MYEYKFEKIDVTSPLMGDSKPKGDYHEMVHQYAKKGWRLVQVFAPSLRAPSKTGAAYFELIFERKK